MSSKSRELPLFPLNTVLFPGGPLPLRIFEPRYLDMISRCFREQTGFVVVLQVERAEPATPTRFVAVGTEARIVDFDRLEDGLLGISCLGEERVRVQEAWEEPGGLHIGRVMDVEPDARPALPLSQAYLGEIVQRVLKETGAVYRHVESREDAAWVGNRLAEMLPLAHPDKQALLELTDPLERLSVLERSIKREES